MHYSDSFPSALSRYFILISEWMWMGECKVGSYVYFPISIVSYTLFPSPLSSLQFISSRTCHKFHLFTVKTVPILWNLLKMIGQNAFFIRSMCFTSSLHSFQSILSLTRKWRESRKLSMATWTFLHGTRPNLFLVQNVLVPLNSQITISLDKLRILWNSASSMGGLFDLCLSVHLCPKREL